MKKFAFIFICVFILTINSLAIEDNQEGFIDLVSLYLQSQGIVLTRSSEALNGFDIIYQYWLDYCLEKNISPALRNSIEFDFTNQSISIGGFYPENTLYSDLIYDFGVWLSDKAGINSTNVGSDGSIYLSELELKDGQMVGLYGMGTTVPFGYYPTLFIEKYADISSVNYLEADIPILYLFTSRLSGTSNLSFVPRPAFSIGKAGGVSSFSSLYSVSSGRVTWFSESTEVGTGTQGIPTDLSRTGLLDFAMCFIISRNDGVHYDILCCVFFADSGKLLCALPVSYRFSGNQNSIISAWQEMPLARESIDIYIDDPVSGGFELPEARNDIPITGSTTVPLSDGVDFGIDSDGNFSLQGGFWEILLRIWRSIVGIPDSIILGFQRLIDGIFTIDPALIDDIKITLDSKFGWYNQVDNLINTLLESDSRTPSMTLTFPDLGLFAAIPDIVLDFSAIVPVLDIFRTFISAALWLAFVRSFWKQVPSILGGSAMSEQQKNKAERAVDEYL